jgi:hypothetical protein
MKLVTARNIEISEKICCEELVASAPFRGYAVLCLVLCYDQ